MAVDDRIREAQGAIALIQGRKARAAVELDNAKTRVSDARRALAEEFGVTTSDEARAKLTELQSELDLALAEIETKLAEAGA